MLPPNPAELDTRHAAALAEEAGRAFAYLARLARAAAALAASEAEEAAYLAPLEDDPEQGRLTAHRVAGLAEWAAKYADSADNALIYLGDQGSTLTTAAEDIEPEAVAEVAAAIARAMSAALVGVVEHGS